MDTTQTAAKRMRRKKGNIMQSNTQNNTQSTQAYIVQSIKGLTSLLDDQAPNLQTVQDIIKTCQELLQVQQVTEVLVQAQEEYIDFAEQPVPEVINDETVAAYKAKRQALRSNLLRAYAAYTALEIPRCMRDPRIWSPDRLAART